MPGPDVFPAAEVGDSATCGRSVLRLLYESPTKAQIPQPASPGQCANCGVKPHGKRSPFCGEECRAMASFIRQSRSAVASELILDPERQLGLGQTFWNLLHGGYPHRLTLIPESARRRVIAQRNEECEICGGAGTTFDHIKTACNRPINLRLVCQNCTVTRPFHDPTHLAEARVRETLDQVQTRFQSAEPVQPCDDFMAWDWRAYIAGAQK